MAGGTNRDLLKLFFINVTPTFSIPFCFFSFLLLLQSRIHTNEPLTQACHHRIYYCDNVYPFLPSNILPQCRQLLCQFYFDFVRDRNYSSSESVKYRKKILLRYNTQLLCLVESHAKLNSDKLEKKKKIIFLRYFSPVVKRKVVKSRVRFYGQILIFCGTFWIFIGNSSRKEIKCKDVENFLMFLCCANFVQLGVICGLSEGLNW